MSGFAGTRHVQSFLSYASGLAKSNRTIPKFKNVKSKITKSCAFLDIMRSGEIMGLVTL